MISAFGHGFILALGLILPLGPQNIFVFNQGILQHRLKGALPVVLMAATCDTVLILIGVLGVSLIILEFAWFKVLMTIIGVLFLSYIGFTTWRSEVQSIEHDNAEQWPLRRRLMFTASVSLLNPHAIADTIGVLGTSSLAYATLSNRMSFTGAVIMVSWLWFLVLAIAGHLLGNINRIRSWQRRINKASAVLIWLSGIILVKSLLG